MMTKTFVSVCFLQTKKNKLKQNLTLSHCMHGTEVAPLSNLRSQGTFFCPIDNNLQVSEATASFQQGPDALEVTPIVYRVHRQPGVECPGAVAHLEEDAGGGRAVVGEDHPAAGTGRQGRATCGQAGGLPILFTMTGMEPKRGDFETHPLLLRGHIGTRKS